MGRFDCTQCVNEYFTMSYIHEAGNVNPAKQFGPCSLVFFSCVQGLLATLF